MSYDTSPGDTYNGVSAVYQGTIECGTVSYGDTTGDYRHYWAMEDWCSDGLRLLSFDTCASQNTVQTVQYIQYTVYVVHASLFIYDLSTCDFRQ